MTLIIKIMNMMLILLKFFIHNNYSVYHLIFDIALHTFQLNISFNEKTEVFEYPSFESVDLDFKQTADKTMTESSNNQETSQQSSSLFKSNSTVGSSGIFSANNKPCHKSTPAYNSILYNFIHCIQKA